MLAKTSQSFNKHASAIEGHKDRQNPAGDVSPDYFGSDDYFSSFNEEELAILDVLLQNSSHVPQQRRQQAGPLQTPQPLQPSPPIPAEIHYPDLKKRLLEQTFSSLSTNTELGKSGINAKEEQDNYGDDEGSSAAVHRRRKHEAPVRRGKSARQHPQQRRGGAHDRSSVIAIEYEEDGHGHGDSKGHPGSSLVVDKTGIYALSSDQV